MQGTDTKHNIYAVITKRAAKAKERAFIVTEKRVEWMGGCFHCCGYWADKAPEERDSVIDLTTLKEVWIPWQNIDHIENLGYKRGG